jgi:hypothetical protein
VKQALTIANTNTNGNNHNNIIREDDGEIEDYEPTDPDNFKAHITNIASCTHEDLVHNTAIGARSFMTYWEMHSYRWYCYNCSVQLVSTGKDTWDWSVQLATIWKHPWETMRHIGILALGRCNNIRPAEVTCVTCLLNQGNMNTYAALKKAMKIYQEKPTLFHPKEFVILANYYHYLHEHDTWNRLKWYE